MERVRAGQDWKPRKASDENAIAEATEYFQQQIAMGEAGAGNREIRDSNTLWLKNATGSDLAQGRVLEIGAKLLTALDPDNPWFTGSTPAPDGTKGIAVALKPTPSNAIYKFQVFGRCRAKVNINHEQQTYADVDDSSTLLQSKWYGRAFILDRESTGTGEKWCEILLGTMHLGPIKVVLTEDIAPGASGDADVKWGPAGILADPTSTIAILYDHMAGTSNALNGMHATVFWDPDEQAYMIYELGCTVPE